MKKTRINTSLRHKLENYVRNQIQDSIDQTPLVDAKRRLKAEALRLVQDAYPHEDMTLLAKYGKASRYERFTFHMPSGEERQFDFDEALPHALPDSSGFRFTPAIAADEAFAASAGDLARIEERLRAEARRQWKQAEVLVGCALYFEDVLDYLAIPDGERVNLARRWCLPLEQSEPVAASEESGESGAAISPTLTLTDAEMPDIDITDYLEQRRQIAAIWSIEDVQEQRSDLNDEQAWEVLQHVKQYHDCNYGITWETLEATASDLFPEPEQVEASEAA